MTTRTNVCGFQAVLLLQICGSALAQRPGDVQSPAPADEEFDVLEGWTAHEGVKAEIKEGRLILEGGGRLIKRFHVSPETHPVIAVQVDEATRVYNIGARPPGGPREQIAREDHGAYFEKPLPARGPGEVTLEVDIITLDGGRYAIDYIRFLPPPKRPGMEAPTAAGTLAPPAQATAEHRQLAWYVENEDFSLAVWKSNGCLAAGWIRETGERVFAYSPDLYRFEQIDSETEGYENSDEVVAHRASEDGRALELVCRNPRFQDLEIRKRYFARPEPNIIGKQLEFRTEKDWRGMIHWISNVGLDPDFRRGGYYNNTAYHPKKDPLIPADEVRVPITQPIRQQIIFWSPRRQHTVGHYRIRVDGGIVGPRCGFTGGADQYLTPEGWQFKSLLDRLWPQKAPSATVHYTVVPGDFVAFHRQYMALPEYKEVNAREPPDWVAEVKGNAPAVTVGPEKLKEWNGLLDEGYGVWIWWFVFNLSDYHTKGAWTMPQASLRPGEVVAQSEAGIRDTLKSLRRQAPRYKIGPHVWYHSVLPGSEVFRSHPDWFRRTKTGDYPVDHETLHGRLLIPEHVDWLRERTRSMMRDFDFDLFYIDGGGFGATQVDWPTLRVTQPADFMRLHEGLRVDGRPTWHNAANGLYGFFNAMGYFEGFIEPHDWRALSVKLFEVKLYQQPGTWTMPLYLRKENAQRYTSYCVLLGLKPRASVSRPNLPLINMGYELNPMMLQDIGVTPCWWKESTELEAYALGWRDQFFITLLNHAGEEKEYPVGFDPALTELVPERPTYLWHLRTRPATELALNRLSEPEDRRLYDESGWSPIALAQLDEVAEYSSPKEASRVVFTVRPDAAELVAVTQTPAMIWSVNGHRKYFPLSRTRWGEVSGTRAGDVIALQANVDQRCEVAVLLPAGWGVVDAQVDGRRVPYRRALPDLAVVPVPPGAHVVRLTRTEATIGAPVRAAIVAPEKVFRGQTIEAKVEFGEGLPAIGTAFVNVSRGNTPLYTSPPLPVESGARRLLHPIDVPAKALPGAYELLVALDGMDLKGPQARTGNGRAYLAVPLQIELKPMSRPEGWDVRANCRCETREANHDALGFTVLRAFEQTAELNPENRAEADPAATTLMARMGEARVAGYAHAGLEFADLRVFGSHIAFGGPPKLDTFDKDPDAHLSFSVDYHTPVGYTKRVYLSLSKVREHYFTARSQPWWGTALEEDAEVTTEVIPWRRKALTPHGNVWRESWDLAQWAPEDWDGRVIVGSNASMASPGTYLFLRIKAQAKLGHSPESAKPAASPERQWTNVRYRRLEPITYGAGAVAQVRGADMTFKAKAPAPGTHAFCGIQARDLFMVRLDVKARGTAFAVVDYLGPTGCDKRALLMLSGEDPAAVADTLEGLTGLGECDGDLVVMDLRKEIAEAPNAYLLGLGKYAPQEWGKSCLFRVGALGPNGSIRVRILENETFWRF